MVVKYCPILRTMPRPDDCHYCPMFNYRDQQCEHEDAPSNTHNDNHIDDYWFGEKLDLKPIHAELNHLTNKLNKHLEEKKLKDDSF